MSSDSQIRAKLNQINSIEGRIDQARGQYNAAAARKREFERRKHELQNIKNNLAKSFDGVVNAVRRRQNDTRTQLERATSGLPHEGVLTVRINGDTESETEQDTHLSQTHHYLQMEINRCDQEINNAQSTMNSCNSTISSCKSQRSSLISQAKKLSNNKDATIKIRTSAGY